MAGTGWQFWIDRGGTFTDVIGRSPDQTMHSQKLLSDNPEHYADAAVEGICRVLHAAGSNYPVDEIRMGTTVATNALLQRTGSATGLLITRGFRDALRIGYQNRPDIFALEIKLPQPLYTQVAEIDERIDASGKVLQMLDDSALPSLLQDWQHKNIASLAICFMHAWTNPVHEKRVAQIARAAGFTQISTSHEVSPLMKLVSRGNTTVADAYLAPVLSHYIDNFQQELLNRNIRCPHILFMQSNGGLVTANLLRGKDSILSGPAGGVVGMAAAAKRAEISKLIGFDMGGTSTDASIYSGHTEIVNETTIAGITLSTPMIRIHTIAAGGGSVLNFSNGRFQAGPESAGADPGPKCYGRGGPLTVTDANLLLGRIQAAYFPATFGPGADQPLNRNIVEQAFIKLARQISSVTGRVFTPQQTAQGFVRVAIENMANALRHISIQRGLNPADYTLCSFGGAGGQHACQIADRIGISRILLDPLAGMLSAWGMGAAPLKSYRQQTINQPLTEASLRALDQRLTKLEAECRDVLHQQGVADSCIRINTWLALKADGSDTSIELPLNGLSYLQTGFITAHQARFGFAPDHPELIIESLRIEAEDQPDEQLPEQISADAGHSPETMSTPPISPDPVSHAPMYINDQLVSVPIYDRALLSAGMQLPGPAIISEQTGTIVVEPDWELQVNNSLQLLLTRSKQPSPHEDVSTGKDPVMLEIFSNHFMHIADEMGVVLQKTARSVNIKERLDFSCALFNPAGDLIANAPHIPVHLGSMDESIKSLLRTHSEGLQKGHIYLCNAPYNGGTHLPDLTVVTPVPDATGKLIFVVASRAHHADIGGISPGSMPATSRHIEEEGIVFDNFLLVAEGQFREAELRDKLNDTTNPARNPAQNIADCKAQIAANERGRHLLLEMVSQYGIKTVHAYVGHTLDNAEEAVREIITTLDDLNNADGNTGSDSESEPGQGLSSQGENSQGKYSQKKYTQKKIGISSGSFCYPFDNGQKINVCITLDRDKREAHIDFSGTSPAADNNLNAPASVCQAAVMYVFRTLVQTDIPLNAGCRRPLKLTIPAGCMLDPHFPAAVVGGNVETSQCITDALYGALGILAASQGTMNNLSFGNKDMQYYETICGGAGAGPGFNGADAVQTHMTNSRMTDAEVLEARYPILVREFSIRHDSGGAGKYKGGNGVTRKLEFRTAMSAAILSNHRRVAPFGLAGGQNAMTGLNTLERHNGTVENLDGIVTIEVQEKDVLVIKTPGGGGYGSPSEAT